MTAAFKQCNPVRPLDQSGILYYLGSKGGVESYTNPADSGRITLTASESPATGLSFLASNQPSKSTISWPEMARNVQYPYHWIHIDMKTVMVQLSAFEIETTFPPLYRHFAVSSTMELQGSLDSQQWTTIHSCSLWTSNLPQSRTFSIDSAPSYYRHFRFLSPSGLGHFSRIEFYGKLTPSTQLTRTNGLLLASPPAELNFSNLLISGFLSDFTVGETKLHQQMLRLLFKSFHQLQCVIDSVDKWGMKNLRQLFLLVYGDRAAVPASLGSVSICRMACLAHFLGYDCTWLISRLDATTSSNFKLLRDLITTFGVRDTNHPLIQFLCQRIRSLPSLPPMTKVKRLMESDETFFFQICPLLFDKSIPLVNISSTLRSPNAILSEMLVNIAPVSSDGSLRSSSTGCTNFKLFFAPPSPPSASKTAVVHVHDWVLASRWKYFERLLQSGLTEAKEKAADFSSMLTLPAGLCLLASIYSVNVTPISLRPYDCQLVIANAEALGLNSQPEVFRNFLEVCGAVGFPLLTPENCMETLADQLRLGLKDKLETTIQFVAQNLPKVKKTSDVNTQLASLPIDIMSKLISYQMHQ